MSHSTIFQAAWRSLWLLRRRHDAPAWARLLMAACTGTWLALVLMAMAALLGEVGYPNWWVVTMFPNILIGMCIVLCYLATLRLAELALPSALLTRLEAAYSLRHMVLVGALTFLGVVIGIASSFALIPPLFGFDLWSSFHSAPISILKFGGFLFIPVALNWAWWHAHLRHEALQRDAIEAQLRLLQAQIEPHFLFNTLANVQSLMDHDSASAKRMLEAFSDYLRAGLSQLRQTDSSVGAELDMAKAYLELLQIRMGDRLAFSIDAGENVRSLRLPTLLLQPLVENAIHHGLEPKVEGGSIRLVVQAKDDRLHLHVDDDGMGLDAPRRTLRSGTGMALANLRTRLHTRYGDSASLTLSALPTGTRAALELPCAP
ncbi:MAG: sensor histidine kinase [Massilia sp.]